MPNKIELSRGIDAWSGVHLLGCYFLMTIMRSWPDVLLGGVFWELLDYLYACVKNEVPSWLSVIFDPRGADIMDIVFDAIGIALYLVLNFYNIVG